MMRKAAILLGFLTLTLSVNLRSQVRINELMASNATAHADLDFGTYCDWIELHNTGDEDLDLSGWFLSNDVANPRMWEFQSGTTLPAHEFLLVYSDGRGMGLHSNFKLDKDGEGILLLDSQSKLVDTLSFPLQRTDISYGRSEDGSPEKCYFESPSPGWENEGGIFNGISATPVFSRESGFYATFLALGITSDDPLVSIHYTSDGSEPRQSDLRYTGPIEIRQSTVIRAKSFREGMLEGSVVSRSYFINEEQNLPVISLATNPDNFFSDQYGIYVEGTAGTGGYCTDVPHNINQDWERPVNIELIEKDGSRGLNQMAGVKIFGGCSRVRYPIKSLAFFARKEYENSSFSYPLFPDRANDSYESFILRASADDQPFTLFRDPLAQMLVKDVIDVDVQAYRPVVVYINGEYWGIHNMREKINEHYARDNFGVNPDSVDMIKRNPESAGNVIAGNADHYNAMIAYLEENDISQDVHYEYMSTQMDMDEYLNYQIVQIFFGGRDWPGNNIKFWRSREEPYNRWRWILYDLDHVFKEYFSDIMAEATEVDCECTWPNPPWSTNLFRTLLKNESFKQEFLRRFAIYSDTHFARERLHQYIDDLQAELAPEIPRHIERWGGAKTELPNHSWISPLFSSVEEWEKNVDVMRHFTDTRHELAMKFVNEYFATEGLSTLRAHVEPAGSGMLKIGGTEVPGQSFTVDFSTESRITARALVKPGYLFSHWTSSDLLPGDSSLITRGEQWKYLVSRNRPSSGWMDLAYDDADWVSGAAELGYGDGDEATVIGYGDDPDNKNITTWFRKNFSIKDTGYFSSYTLHMIRDDGARIFINGVEVIRDNLQRWSVGASSTAQSQISGSDESIWQTYPLNPALFKNDSNVFAVEIHQASQTSSDLSFDLELVARRYANTTPKIHHGEVLELDMQDGKEITAFLIPDTLVHDHLHINEIVASSSDGIRDEMGEYEDWIEIYNSGDKTVDLAGLFLADNMLDLENKDESVSWAFPSNQAEITSVEAKAYKLVFADNEEGDGPLHTNFKLSRSGEEVVLFQKIGDEYRVIDHLVFGNQNTDISFGRYPDGAPVFDFMSLTTPEAPNTLATSFQDTDYSLDNPEESILIYPVPTQGPLHIQFSEELSQKDFPVRLMVYSMTGSLVHDSQHRSSSLISLSLKLQARGMYMLRLTGPGQTFVKTVILH
ncbi:MAG: CotH kinase family protein [Bacteroides sp.]|nr:CotH kinase family protein [Bacteroides sp.]